MDATGRRAVIQHEVITPAPLLGPIHGVLLAFPVALFPAALVSDIAYLNTAEIQWSNFSSWLIAGADVFTGLLLAFAIISLFFGRLRAQRNRGLVYTGFIAVLFVAGVLNAFQHAKDGWHSVGTFGLVLSIVCAVIALLLGFLAHWHSPRREHQP